MKLQFTQPGRSQADPFIFEDGGKFYLYVTAHDGVEAYSASEPQGPWEFHGVICARQGWTSYWAPCILKQSDAYYLYFSCETEGKFQFLHAARGASPLGPFEIPKQLYDRFTIDAHVVETEAGIFLFYAEDNREHARFGTRIFLDRLLDPMTPANLRKEILVPTRDEEIFQRNRLGDGRDWHTLEGPFWFREGDWQYLMYSGGCFLNDTYHIGYAAAKTDCADLTAVDFQKANPTGDFAPVLVRGDGEEGTGHHSVLKYKGAYYCVYHGWDEGQGGFDTRDPRTARICRLHVQDGVLTAGRMEKM